MFASFSLLRIAPVYELARGSVAGSSSSLHVYDILLIFPPDTCASRNFLAASKGCARCLEVFLKTVFFLKLLFGLVFPVRELLFVMDVTVYRYLDYLFSAVNAFSQRLCTANSKGPCVRKSFFHLSRPAFLLVLTQR